MLKAIPFFISNLTFQIGNWALRLVYFWLVQAPLGYWKAALFLTLTVEDMVAVIITLRNLFAPLYQDYSIIGRIIGPVFRIFRVILGLILHLTVFVFEIGFFIVFLLLLWGSPVYFVFNLFIIN
jgi:hypothetical protein